VGGKREVGRVATPRLDAEVLLQALSRVLGAELPRPTEFHLDEEADVLFIRFREPEGAELGEPAPTRSLITVFTDEVTGAVTAVEIVGVEDAVEELCEKIARDLAAAL